MEPQFFVVEGSRMYGPVGLETVKQWAAEGRINAYTTLRNVQDGSSALAGNVLNLPFKPTTSPPSAFPQAVPPGPVDNAANSLSIWAVVLSILATFVALFTCVFAIIGVGAIVCAVVANSQLKRRDFVSSKRFSWISIGASALALLCTAGFYGIVVNH